MAHSWEGMSCGDRSEIAPCSSAGLVLSQAVLSPAAVGGLSSGVGSSPGLGVAPRVSPTLRGPCSPALPCHRAVGPRGYLAGGNGVATVASHWVSFPSARRVAELLFRNTR